MCLGPTQTVLAHPVLFHVKSVVRIDGALQNPSAKLEVSNRPKLVNYPLISKLTIVILSAKMVLRTKVIKQIKIISMLMKLFKRIERMAIIIELVLPQLMELLPHSSKFSIYRTKEKLQTQINNR